VLQPPSSRFPDDVGKQDNFVLEFVSALGRASDPNNIWRFYGVHAFVDDGIDPSIWAASVASARTKSHFQRIVVVEYVAPITRVEFDNLHG
jgi:hypothetical protein